jgi:hypothetical protein
MHLLAAAYCLEHDIHIIADGSHPSGAALFPEQTDQPLEVLKEFYSKYKIRYEAPVYHISRPDHVLFELGIASKHNTKNERLYYSNQFSCHVGLIAYIYYYFFRFFGTDEYAPKKTTIHFLKYFLLKNPILDPKNNVFALGRT